MLGFSGSVGTTKNKELEVQIFDGIDLSKPPRLFYGFSKMKNLRS